MRADVLMAIESCDVERMGRVITVARSLGHGSTPEIEELVERLSSPQSDCHRPRNRTDRHRHLPLLGLVLPIEMLLVARQC
jgi:hypothetical protein